MEPRIGFAPASDGVRIAYAVSGSGPVLVSVPAPPDNHIQLEWDDPERRANIESLSRYRTLVRFDGRGTGLSDRDVHDFSLEARLSDLEAVVDRLGLERFALISGSHGNQVTVAYAAQHPERVTHLVAVNPFVRGEEFLPPEKMALWRTMLASDYRLFTEALGAEMFGWGTEGGPRYGEFFRKAVEPATAMQLYDAMIRVDLADHLSRVSCPALVLRNESSGMISVDGTRDFVMSLPNAAMSVIPGAANEGTSNEVLARVGAFLGEDWSVAAPAVELPPVRAEAGLQTVLFTDIERHTEMIQRLGDDAGRTVLREYERLTRDALRQYGGAEVKAMGDGFMASFRSAQAALDCAQDLQRQFASPVSPLREHLSVRVGLNAGEPIAEDGDLFGTAVITAARIAGLARGSEILCANVVRELVAGKGYLFSDSGHHALRGMDEPVRLWSLRWAGDGP